MCGICGMNIEDPGIIRVMAKAISHRGPDDTAFYTDKGISLGMTRLAIIDLKKGIYPISNEEEDIFLVYNGEIYNFLELKPILEKKGHKFRTNTDAEVIVHGYEEWGTGVLSCLNGMFAIALWDSKKKQLVLARDRFGEKPLYYYNKGKKFVFASEVKALLPADIDRTLDHQALHDFLTLLYLPGNSTLFRHVKKILPGRFLIYKEYKISIKKYWSLPLPKAKKLTAAQAATELRKLLNKSVKMRLISDVPLGAFLSGGVDSSTIVGIMSKLMTEPVKTFSVGFGEDTDELRHARTVSDHFKTDHHELLVTSNFLKRLPEIIYHTDVPTADPTCIPTYYLAEFARKKVTVVLTGEGADEEFFGYDRIQHMMYVKQLAQRYAKIPSIIRKGVKGLVRLTPTLQARRKLKRLPNLEDLQTFYTENNGVLNEPEKNSLYCRAKSFLPTKRLFKAKYKEDLTNLSIWDFDQYLPNDILMKTDTMTMAHGLEARVPFLDPTVAEFSTTIQNSFKLGGLNSYKTGSLLSLAKQPKLVEKYILKKSMKDLIPSSILKRKKQGFTVPLDKWFPKNLKEVASQLLDEQALKESGIFDYKKVRDLYPILGKLGGYYRLWPLLYFQMWHKIFIASPSPESGIKSLKGLI